MSENSLDSFDFTQSAPGNCTEGGVVAIASRNTTGQAVYLMPEQLSPNEANTKARPGESQARRAERIASMAASIRQNGQQQPVLIVALDAGRDANQNPYPPIHEYIDGGCRVDAIDSLNQKRGENEAALAVWCVLVDPSADLFRMAVVGNIHRTQNSPLEMALIIQEVMERNVWNGRGGAAKAATWLGLHQSQVSSYRKLLHAPEYVRSRLESGEIRTLDAALALLDVKPEEREGVVERAKDIAKEEQREQNQKEQRGAAPAKRNREAEKIFKRMLKPVVRRQSSAADDKKGGTPAETPETAETTDIAQTKLDAGEQPFEDNGPASGEPACAAIKSKHIKKAAREIATSGHTPRSKADILEFFVAYTVAPYPPLVRSFAIYFGDWAQGKGEDSILQRAFEAAVGHKKPEKAKPAKRAAKKAPRAAKALDKRRSAAYAKPISKHP